MTWTSDRWWYLAALLSGVLSYTAFTLLISGGQPTGPGLFLSAAVLVLVLTARLLFQAARMLVQGGVEADDVQAIGRRRKEMEREYLVVKRALKELELDRAMGKVSEIDYQEIRGRYRERAVRLMRQLDQKQSYRAQIEADLQARRAAQAEPAAPPRAAVVTVSAPQVVTEAKTAEAAVSKAVAEPAAVVEPAVSPKAAEPAVSPKTEEPAVSPKAEPAVEAPREAKSGDRPRRRRKACPRCAVKNDLDAAFCKKCGQVLAS